MSAKKSISQMKVRFLYRVALVEVPGMLGEPSFENQPVEVAHIYRVHGRTVSESAFCGHIFPADVETAWSKQAPARLPLCPGCQTGWKSAEGSAWQRWSSGSLAVLVLFLALACLSPAVAVATVPTGLAISTGEAARQDPTLEPTAERHAHESPEARVCMIVTAAESLHVRDLPEGQVVGYLFAGDVVEVLDQQEAGGVTWWLSSMGWSSGVYLESAPCP